MKDNEFCSFEQYCFLSKIFYDNEDVKAINEYVNNAIRQEDFLEKIENINTAMGKHFAIFMNEFHAGKFIIKTQRKIAVIINQNGSSKSPSSAP